MQWFKPKLLIDTLNPFEKMSMPASISLSLSLSPEEQSFLSTGYASNTCDDP